MEYLNRYKKWFAASFLGLGSLLIVGAFLSIEGGKTFETQELSSVGSDQKVKISSYDLDEFDIKDLRFKGRKELKSGESLFTFTFKVTDKNGNQIKHAIKSAQIRLNKNDTQNKLKESLSMLGNKSSSKEMNAQQEEPKDNSLIKQVINRIVSPKTDDTQQEEPKGETETEAMSYALSADGCNCIEDLTVDTDLTTEDEVFQELAKSIIKRKVKNDLNKQFKIANYEVESEKYAGKCDVEIVKNLETEMGFEKVYLDHSTKIDCKGNNIAAAYEDKNVNKYVKAVNNLFKTCFNSPMEKKDRNDWLTPSFELLRSRHHYTAVSPYKIASGYDTFFSENSQYCEEKMKELAFEDELGPYMQESYFNYVKSKNLLHEYSQQEQYFDSTRMQYTFRDPERRDEYDKIYKNQMNTISNHYGRLINGHLNSWKRNAPTPETYGMIEQWDLISQNFDQSSKYLSDLSLSDGATPSMAPTLDPKTPYRRGWRGELGDQLAIHWPEVPITTSRNLPQQLRGQRN